MSRAINKYERARIMAKMSREQAADAIPYSVSSIKRIEYGEQTPTPEVERAMAKAYNAPWVADAGVPKNYKPLPKTEAAMKYIKERNDVNRVMERATEILADGVIDDSEAEDFKTITREISEERDAGRDLLYAVGG